MTDEEAIAIALDTLGAADGDSLKTVLGQMTDVQLAETIRLAADLAVLAQCEQSWRLLHAAEGEAS